MSKNEFIEEYTSLVRIIASRYRYSRVSFNDLIQEGLMGLLEAQKRFDPHRGVKFSTFASYWIRKKILQALYYEKRSSLNAVNFDAEDMESLAEIPPDVDIPQDRPIVLPADFPQMEAKILGLFFEENKTFGEIADILSFSKEKTRQLYRLALRRLKFNLKLTKT